MRNNHPIQDLFYSDKKKIAVLIDPDKYKDPVLLKKVLLLCNDYVDFIFIGGSLIVEDNFKTTIETIKNLSSLPLILFPGSPTQVFTGVDAVLFLSLISGRNPESLIGQHVIAAPIIKAKKIEPLATGYLLIDCGASTTASYISNSFPIPNNKPEISACTAMAGEMLGLKLMYLDGGSGAKNPVPADHIALVKKTVDVPIIVGGGIKNKDMAHTAFSAGADVVVIGNALEQNPDLIIDICSYQTSHV